MRFRSHIYSNSWYMALNIAWHCFCTLSTFPLYQKMLYNKNFPTSNLLCVSLRHGRACVFDYQGARQGSPVCLILLVSSYCAGYFSEASSHRVLEFYKKKSRAQKRGVFNVGDEDLQMVLGLLWWILQHTAPQALMLYCTGQIYCNLITLIFVSNNSRSKHCGKMSKKHTHD